MQLQCILGRLACKRFDQLRRITAAIKIEKHFRRYHASKAYSSLRISAIKVQAAVRALKARKEFKVQKQTKAIIKIQVNVIMLRYILTIYLV